MLIVKLRNRSSMYVRLVMVGRRCGAPDCNQRNNVNVWVGLPDASHSSAVMV